MQNALEGHANKMECRLEWEGREYRKAAAALQEKLLQLLQHEKQMKELALQASGSEKDKDRDRSRELTALPVWAILGRHWQANDSVTLSLQIPPNLSQLVFLSNSEEPLLLSDTFEVNRAWFVLRSYCKHVL